MLRVFSFVFLLSRHLFFVGMLFACSVSWGGEKIVFQAFPSIGNGKELSKEDGAKSGILIKKVNGKYVWASRQDKELIYSKSGMYHIFVARGGAGMISIADPTMLAKFIKDPNERKKLKIEYGEHIRNGITFISYYGSASFVSP